MKTAYYTRYLALIMALIMLAGCATPQKLRDKRIATKQNDFLQLPSNTQTRVRAGEIAVGDAPLTVWFALGAPNNEFTQATEAGTNSIWSYTEQDINVRHEVVPSYYGSRYYGGDSFIRSKTVTESEKQRITFATNKVISIDNNLNSK